MAKTISYKKSQEKRAIAILPLLFKNPGGGSFRGLPRANVLTEAELNIWEGIRSDAINYFSKNKIAWWDSSKKPTGHLLSSQVSCVNHLYFIRQREDIASRILRKINSNFKRAIIIDDGFIEFEKVGKARLGKEKVLTRGANCTSVDALMLAEDDYGKRTLVLIEWKYIESYSPDDKSLGTSGKVRLETYKDFLSRPDCPINPGDYKDCFFEPFYQLMRQTFLGWTMSQLKEYRAEDWIHIHVIPEDNLELRNTVTSHGLTGKNLEEAWRNVLIEPHRYTCITPKDFLNPIYSCRDSKSLTDYLEIRYW